MKYYIQNQQLYKVRTALGEGYDLSQTNSLEDFQAGKIITLTPEQIEFYKANRNATTQEIWDCALTAIEVPEPTLEQVKAEKIRQLLAYDRSPAVNSFTLFGNEMWLDRNTRMSLMQTALILEQAGETKTTLWTEGDNQMPIEVSLLELQYILSILEIYAKKCYDVTAQHKYNIQHMDNKEDILAYDHTANYPDRIIINTPNNE